MLLELSFSNRGFLSEGGCRVDKNTIKPSEDLSLKASHNLSREASQQNSAIIIFIFKRIFKMNLLDHLLFRQITILKASYLSVNPKLCMAGLIIA